MAQPTRAAPAQDLHLQAKTRGTVPRDALTFAVHRVRLLLQRAPGPVLFARIELTMAPDPAVDRPAIAQASIDLNGRPVRAQAAGQTLREATEQMADRLRTQLQRHRRTRTRSRSR